MEQGNAKKYVMDVFDSDSWKPSEVLAGEWMAGQAEGGYRVHSFTVAPSGKIIILMERPEVDKDALLLAECFYRAGLADAYQKARKLLDRGRFTPSPDLNDVISEYEECLEALQESDAAICYQLACRLGIDVMGILAAVHVQQAQEPVSGGVDDSSPTEGEQE